jgi:hypothetical protein
MPFLTGKANEAASEISSFVPGLNFKFVLVIGQTMVEKKLLFLFCNLLFMRLAY